MTAYTRSVIVVVRPQVADAANTAMKHASFDAAGGERTFTAPLRAAGDATNTVTAYWAAGVVTPAMLTGLRDRMLAAGATAAEASLIPKTTTFSSISSQRVFCYDRALWSPPEVLAFMGLATLAQKSVAI